MVNHEMMTFGPGHSEILVSFTSLSQRALFNVLLADMLEPVDPGLLGGKGSLLRHLSNVASDPHLGTADHARELVVAVMALSDWLETDIEVPVWFPAIESNTRLKLKREDFVSICGNISKHNLSRLTRNAKRLSWLLQENGIVVDWVDALRALDDFNSRFHDDILVYHTTTLAELLNNVRWGVHEYLLPEFVRSYTPAPSQSDPTYTYSYPDGIENGFARSRYWDLMNYCSCQTLDTSFHRHVEFERAVLNALCCWCLHSNGGDSLLALAQFSDRPLREWAARF